MRIPTKIVLMTGATWLVGIVTAFALSMQLKSVERSYDSILAHEVAQQDLARTVQVTFKKQVQEWKDLLIRGKDPRAFQKHSEGFDAQRRAVREKADELASQVTDPAARQLAVSFVVAHANLATRYDDARRAFAADPAREATAADRMVAGIDREATGLVDQIVASIGESIGRARAEEQRHQARNERALLVAWSILLLAGSALTWAFIRSITTPLRMVTDAAARIAVGDVAQRVDHRASDEIGQLSDSFRAMTSYLQDLSTAADSMSRGDLSIEVTVKSDQDALSRSFGRLGDTVRALIKETNTLIVAAKDGALQVRGNAGRFAGGFGDLIGGINTMMDTILAPVNEASSVLGDLALRDLTVRMKGEYRGDLAVMKDALNIAADNLHNGFVQVASAVEQLTSAADQISAGSQTVAEGASEQASSLEETSASLEEMSSMTQRNAESAGRASALAGATRTASESGSAQMAQLIRAMGRISAAAEGTATILRDINDIAFQTNLLALNAAVEAARAGEAGRGFAIVAEEVRSLAMRSKEAAKKTEVLIKDSVSLAQEGEQICLRVNVNLDEIVASAGKVSAVVEAIARASDEQARGITQLNHGVAQMDTVTQQNAASSEESASAAEELSGQAEELRALVGQFQLGGEAARPPPAARPVASRPARRDLHSAPGPAVRRRKASKAAVPALWG